VHISRKHRKNSDGFTKLIFRKQNNEKNKKRQLTDVFKTRENKREVGKLLLSNIKKGEKKGDSDGQERNEGASPQRQIVITNSV